MNGVIPLILRAMRAPLVVLISAYAISILGLVLSPGPVIDGEVQHLSFFHAFYVISYTATTIGFGEIPYTFSDAQRLWVVVSIYLSVVAWVFGIGRILALLQDAAFRQAVKERAFARSIRALRDPFYIVCGYGDTGSLLVRALMERGHLAVVIDSDAERIGTIDLEEYPIHVPGLVADASLAGPLTEAGLLQPSCRGVVAVTGSDATNLKIAITVKLLAPHLKVSCRADNTDTEANLASFGTDQIINPFDVFGDRLALAIHSPVQHLLHEWLTGVPNTPLPMPLYPARGTWILCGYGRFGHEVAEDLRREGVDIVVVEQNEKLLDCSERCVVGRGTEAPTLLDADIHKAVGIVAGTDDDANNLSIVMTARALKPDLFMVARQNRRDHDAIFQAANLHLVMQRSETITRRILTLLATPLLMEFLDRARAESNEWANEVVSRISAITGDVVPEVWSLELCTSDAPAIIRVLLDDEPVTLRHVLSDPRHREARLPIVPLLLRRCDQPTLITPDEDQPLHVGDRLLLCGPSHARVLSDWIACNHNVLTYVRTGEERPAGWIWGWLASLKPAARSD